MSTEQHQSFLNRRVLKFNVGFLLVQGAGHQKDIDLDLPRVRVSDDLDLDYLCGPLRFSRNSRGILVQADLDASVAVECSRCLAVSMVPIRLEIEELFAYPASDESDYAVEETGVLDLAPLLREETILATPMGVVCRPDCAGLCPVCGQNLNEGPCECERDDVDPRLAILRSLKEDKDTH